MKILVIGGTKFFGRHLVNALIKNQHDVYVFTRGNVDLNFEGKFTAIKGDRKKREDLVMLFSHGPFDVVYDQICMTAKDAELLSEFLVGQTSRFVMTSTASVYDIEKDEEYSEDKFDYEKFVYATNDPEIYDYQLAKRNAEAIYFQKLSKYIKVAMVRFPIVIGRNDVSLRFKWHVDRVKNNQPIFFPNIDALATFVYSKDAGEFLATLAINDFVGAINCTCDDHLSLKKIIEVIEVTENKKANLIKEEIPNSHSPYGFPNGIKMPNTTAKSLGFKFTNLLNLIHDLSNYYNNNQ